MIRTGSVDSVRILSAAFGLLAASNLKLFYSNLRSFSLLKGITVKRFFGRLGALVSAGAIALYAFHHHAEVSRLENCLRHQGGVPMPVRQQSFHLSEGWFCETKVNVASDQCKEKGGEPLLFDDLKLICKYPSGQLKSV